MCFLSFWGDGFYLPTYFSGCVSKRNAVTFVSPNPSTPLDLGFKVRQGQFPQDAAHDFAAAGLRQARRPVDLVRRREGTDDFADLGQIPTRPNLGGTETQIGVVEISYTSYTGVCVCVRIYI